MAKKPQIHVTIKFHGTELELKNVKVINITSQAAPFMHIEERNGGWQMILTNSPITELLESKDRILINQNTIDDNLRRLEIVDIPEAVIAVTKAARIKVDHRFMHIDAMSDGCYRLTYGQHFIPTTVDITSVEIIKE